MELIGSIAVLVLRYSLLIVSCAILMSIPMPTLTHGGVISYLNITTALIFLIVGFYTGSVWSVKRLEKEKLNQLWNSLSHREREVAVLIIKGLNNQEICEELFIELNTVKSHLKKIYRKTKCHGRNEFREKFVYQELKS